MIETFDQALLDLFVTVFGPPIRWAYMTGDFFVAWMLEVAETLTFAVANALSVVS